MPEPVLRPFPWRRLAQIAMALAVLATALSFANRKWGVWERQTGDLPVYLRAAERLSAGEEIYRPEDRKPFTYPPFLALPPVPLSKLPVWAHRSTWYCLNLLVVCVLVALVRRHVARFIAGRSRPFWILLAFLSVRHVAAAFQNQTNDLFIALAVLLCADWAARRRELGSGAFAGIGAAIKATPLLFAPVMLWQRRWRAAAAVLVATAALTLLPDMIAPREDGSLWAKAWYDTFLSDMAPGKTAGKVGNAWAATNILNQNLAGTITRLSTPVSGDGNMQIDAAVWHPSPGVLRAVILLAQLGVLALLLWALRRGGGGDHAWRRYGGAGAVACGMVLLSPMSSKSHFCVLVLPFSFLLTDWLYRRRDRVVALVLAGTALTGTLASKGVWGRQLGNEILARGSVTWCAFLALLGTVRVLLAERAADAATDGDVSSGIAGAA